MLAPRRVRSASPAKDDAFLLRPRKLAKTSVQEFTTTSAFAPRFWRPAGASAATHRLQVVDWPRGVLLWRGANEARDKERRALAAAAVATATGGRGAGLELRAPTLCDLRSTFDFFSTPQVALFYGLKGGAADDAITPPHVCRYATTRPLTLLYVDRAGVSLRALAANLRRSSDAETLRAAEAVRALFEGASSPASWWLEAVMSDHADAERFHDASAETDYETAVEDGGAESPPSAERWRRLRGVVRTASSEAWRWHRKPGNRSSQYERDDALLPALCKLLRRLGLDGYVFVGSAWGVVRGSFHPEVMLCGARGATEVAAEVRPGVPQIDEKAALPRQQQQAVEYIRGVAAAGAAAASRRAPQHALVRSNSSRG